MEFYHKTPEFENPAGFRLVRPRRLRDGSAFWLRILMEPESAEPESMRDGRGGGLVHQRAGVEAVH